MARSVSDRVSTEDGKVSIVICTKERHASLQRAIASVRSSGDAGRRAEIIVVEESAAPREIAGVRYVHLPREGKGFGHARNAGVAPATGEIVLFMDDDCEACPGWIEALTAPFGRDGRIVGVAGAVLVKECG